MRMADPTPPVMATADTNHPPTCWSDDIDVVFVVARKRHNDHLLVAMKDEVGSLFWKRTIDSKNFWTI